LGRGFQKRQHRFSGHLLIRDRTPVTLDLREVTSVSAKVFERALP
jgi:hypothetical protein